MSITVAGETYCVYRHTSPSGKVYIGVTCQKAEYRWKNGDGYVYNYHFHNAIKKYGWDNIIHEILFVELSKDAAAEKEIELIQQHQSFLPNHGYNTSLGGGLSTSATRAKISRAMKALYSTPEAKEKMSGIVKESWVNPEVRAARIKSIGRPVRCIETGVEYCSSAEAEIAMGTNSHNIPTCCRSPKKTVGGYHWEYVDVKTIQNRPKQIANNRKRVRCIETEEVYSCVQEAADATGAYNSVIGKCCNRKTGVHTSGGYHWEWADGSSGPPVRIGYNRRSVKCVETGIVYLSIADARVAANSSNIVSCCNGSRRTAGGYHWEYADNIRS